jgi:hypothetical protein
MSKDKPKVGDLTLLGNNLVGMIVQILYINTQTYYRIQWSEGGQTWTAMYGEREAKNLTNKLKQRTENDIK